MPSGKSNMLILNKYHSIDIADKYQCQLLVVPTSVNFLRSIIATVFKSQLKWKFFLLFNHTMHKTRVFITQLYFADEL